LQRLTAEDSNKQGIIGFYGEWVLKILRRKDFGQNDLILKTINLFFMRRVLVFVLIAVVGWSCSGKGWTSDDDALIVYPRDGEAKAVRIEPFDDDIIRVLATSDKFSDEESLVVLKKTRKVPFTVTDKNESVVLTTSNLQVEVFESFGRSSFSRFEWECNSSGISQWKDL
jgi:hypothetical protein